MNKSHNNTPVEIDNSTIKTNANIDVSQGTPEPTPIVQSNDTVVPISTDATISDTPNTPPLNTNIPVPTIAGMTAKQIDDMTEEEFDRLDLGSIGDEIDKIRDDSIKEKESTNNNDTSQVPKDNTSLPSQVKDNQQIDNNIPISDDTSKVQDKLEQTTIPQSENSVSNSDKLNIEDISINGMNIPITDMNELRNLAKQALSQNLEKNIATYDRQSMMILQDNNITSENLSTMIDAMKGNPAAIRSIMGKSNMTIDKLSEDFDNSIDNNIEYIPSVRQYSNSELNINDFVKANRENAKFDKLQEVVSQMDKDSRSFLSEETSYLSSFLQDMNNDTFDKVNNIIQTKIIKDRALGYKTDSYVKLYGEEREKLGKNNNSTNNVTSQSNETRVKKAIVKNYNIAQQVIPISKDKEAAIVDNYRVGEIPQPVVNVDNMTDADFEEHVYQMMQQSQ